MADPTTRDRDVERETAAGGWNPRGLRLLVLGAIVAVLAPLAGFLGGSMVGSSGDAGVDPLFGWLFAGLAVGGGGAFLAFLGGLRWVRANRSRL